MNFKDLLLPIGLAFLSVWALQTFIFNSGSSNQTQHSFKAPRSEQANKPLNTDIDFVDASSSREKQETLVSTEWADLVFSSEGAIIEKMGFKRLIDGQAQTIYTVEPTGHREIGFFLLGLNEKTPYYYRLADVVDTPDDVKITYEASTDECSVRKLFIINKQKNKIDLTVTLRPRGDTLIKPRLFFQAPYMPALQEADVISSVVLDGSGKFARTGRLSLDEDQGWINPAIFGADDRYFIHAMISDGGMLNRAYYRFDEKHGLSAILEGQDTIKEQVWNLSFYVGPKEETLFAAVDPRLDQTLHYYGWLAPLSSLLLKALNFFYDYVHNYGLAIILLTILIKLVLLPFTWRGEQSMSRSKDMSKKLAYLRQRHKDDPETLAREQAEVMRKFGAPMLSGCLPLLLQIPIFFALSRLLSNSFELYRAPMLWISDLSASDPYYIFPVLVAGSMLLNAASAEAQQRFQMVAVALVLGAVTANLSAGLALYLTVSTALGLLQSRLISAFSKA